MAFWKKSHVEWLSFYCSYRNKVYAIDSPMSNFNFLCANFQKFETFILAIEVEGGSAGSSRCSSARGTCGGSGSVSTRTSIRKKHVHRSHHTVWSHNFQKMDVCSHRNIVSSHHQHLITPTKICSHHQFTKSHRHNFVHTMQMLITLLKLLFTPSKFCSHHQFTKSHRHNFVHTMQMLITLLKLLFTPSKFCSHHQFSNRHNFDHTIKMLITLLKSCFTPSKFWSHHLFSGSHLHKFVHTIKMLITLLKSCFTPSKFWAHHLFSRSHRHNLDLCSSTKQVYLGVITTDGCKNDRSSQVYI